MKQLIIYVFSGLFIAIGSLIDTAFGNHLGIDSICVLSAYTIITWITYVVYSIGSYGYRVLLSEAKSCFLCQIIISVIVGIIVFILSNIIPHLYSLTSYQYALFARCLRVHAVSVPFLAVGEYLLNYITLKCNNKLMWIVTIIFYVQMIISDYIVVKFDMGLEWLIVVTGFSYVVQDIILLVFSGIFKEKENISVHGIKECIHHGKRIVIDRLLGKVATIVFNIYASKLDTQLYAIHSVCYSLGVTTEYFTNACYNFQVVELSKQKSVTDKYNRMKYLAKKYYVWIGLVSTLFCLIMMFFTHGDINIKTCWLFVLIYSSQAWLIQLYENYRAFLTVIQNTRYLMWGGLFGIFVRIPVTLISYYTGLGLIGFGLASGIDFFARGIYFMICVKRGVLSCNITKENQVWRYDVKETG